MKLNTWLTKESVIANKIMPYFAKKKMCEITARDVIAWQNEMREQTLSTGKHLSPDYLKNIHSQLSSVFNHAVKFYGMQSNPAAKAGRMGEENPKEMLFWTKEEYLKFIDANELRNTAAEIVPCIANLEIPRRMCYNPVR